MVLFLLSSLALAQDDADATGGSVPEINGQLFRPSIDSTATLWTDESLKAPNKYTMGRFALHYVNDPVVYIDDDGERTELVSGVWQLSLMGAHTRGPLRVGLDLPVYLRSTGDATGGETGLGDLGVDARVTAVDRTEKPIGLAVAGRLTLPTSTVAAPLGGAKTGWELGVIADTELGDKNLLAFNLGTKGVPDQSLENVEWQDQLFARVGFGHEINDATGVSVDVASHFTYGEMTNPAGRPIEGLLGGWKRLGDENSWTLRGGVGTGLNSGIGAPRFRMVAAIAYEPEREAAPEPVVVIPPAQVTVLVVGPDGSEIDGASWSRGDATGTSGDVVELAAGTHAFAASREGLLDGSVSVDVGETGEQIVRIQLDAIPGQLMVSAVDNEDNAVPTAVWKIKSLGLENQPAGTSKDLPPGEYRVLVSAPGYKPIVRQVVVTSETKEVVQLLMEPSKADVTAERIDLRDSVYFETNKDVIKAESFGLLDDVAAIMKAHDELTLVRIEGHTDSRGNDAFNKDLSQRRADAVKTALVERGVEAERLEAVGWGEEKPLDPAENGAAWTKNRRVDFYVAERSD
ncbi:MAG: OmpA family protein [Proteobacteria bacterium]|nr:OmpA family protein [Pseudomonadota bacterium]MCP4919899.1 OmpA family protein [Pseudomonadota bacterium]